MHQLTIQMSDDETKPLLSGYKNKKYKAEHEKKNTSTTPKPTATSTKYDKLIGTPSPSPSKSPQKNDNNRVPSSYKPRKLFNFNGKK